MQQGTSKKVEKPVVIEVYLVRALAMLGVIAVHGTSMTTIEIAGQSDLFWIYQLLNRMGKFGTPVFIFLSSFVLFYNYTGRPVNGSLLKRFYARRLLYIVVPYIIWSFIYFITAALYTDFKFNYPWFTSFSFQELIADVMSGTAYAHLYFVIISIQFYILFPIFLLMASKKAGSGKIAVLLSIAAQWLFYFIYNTADIPFPKGSIFMSYIGFFGLGAYVGTHFNTFKQVFTRYAVVSAIWVSWLGMGLFYSWLYYQANVHAKWYNSFWYEFGWSTYALLSCFTLFHVAFILMTKRKTRLNNALMKLGSVTFGVYLLHPLVLFIWRELPIPNQIYVYHASIWAGIVLALAVPWFVVISFRKLLPSGYWLIFGHWSAPKQSDK